MDLLLGFWVCGLGVGLFGGFGYWAWYIGGALNTVGLPSCVWCGDCLAWGFPEPLIGPFPPAEVVGEPLWTTMCLPGSV